MLHRRKTCAARAVLNFCAVSSVLASGSYGRAAFAQEYESTPPTLIAFESSVDCVSAADFLAALQPRLPTQDIVIVQAAQPGVSMPVQVAVRRTDSGVEATLVVGLKSQEVRRRIEATSCAEARDAIAFVTAIALDPERGSEASLGERPAAERPAPERSAPERPAPSASDDPKQEVVTPDGEGMDCWSVWARFGILGGAAPSLLGGGGLGATWGCRRVGMWSPSLAAGGTFFMSPLMAEEQGSAIAYLFSVPVDLCPSRFGGELFALIPCVAVSGGALLGQGVNTLQPESHIRPWLSVGGSVSLEFVVHPRWALSARGSVEAPLLHYSFQFGDDVFYSVEGVAGRGTFGVLLKL